MKSLYDEKRLDTFGEPPAPGNNSMRLPTGNEWWQLGIAGAIGLFAVGVSSLSHAVVIVDQSNETLNLPLGGLCTIDPYSHCGQSFKQTNNNIAGAGVYLHPDFWPGSPGGVLNLSIHDAYNGYAGTPSGLITGGSMYVTSPGWVDIMWSPETITPGQTYYINAFTTTSGFVPAVSGYDNTYANGGIVYYELYQNGFDLNFRTFAEVEAVPIGSTLPLLGIGLAGLGYTRRKVLPV